MGIRGEGLLYEFGLYQADPLKRRLLLDSRVLPLTSKAFDTLIMLLRNHGRTVSRDELIDEIWADASVEENNLTQQISALRKALGERPGEHRFIVTVPGRGYSFVAPVREITACAFDEIDVYTATPQEDKTTSVGVFFERSKLVGYALAWCLIFSVCFPVFVTYLRQPHPANRLQRLAILGFRSSDSDQVIGNGIRDTLRARLGSVQDLTVRPAAGASADQDAVIAGRDLNVDAVVTGSVQRADERIRVTIEMVDVRDGRIVWGKTFDNSSANLFELQDSIVGEVAQVLEVRLTSKGIESARGILAQLTSSSLLFDPNTFL